jgi:hypothetical protein
VYIELCVHTRAHDVLLVSGQLVVELGVLGISAL